MPLLVHGVVEADTSALPNENEDEIHLVAHVAVAAVVRHVPDQDVLPSRANLLAHTRVLEGLMAEGTVLPMRFGMVAADERELIDGYLAPQQERLLFALDRLRGHVELRLHGRYDEAAVIREILAADPAAAKLRGRRGAEARLRLGERIVKGIESRRDQDLDRVLRALEPHVAGAVANSVSEPLDAFSLSLLVAERGTAAFDHTLDDLGVALAPALGLELVGPVPPFSFAVPEGVPA